MTEADVLIITADDFGYSPRYDEGIVEAAAARAVDAVSVMVTRNRVDREALLETGVETGLHLDLPLELTDGERVGPREREAALHALAEQLEACLLYTSPSPRDGLLSRMPSSA